LPHLVYMVLWICKLAPPPLTHTSSEIHSLTITRWPDWLQGSLWHQKHHEISNRVLVSRRKYSAMVLTHEFAHGLSNSILKSPHFKSTTFKSLIFTRGSFKVLIGKRIGVNAHSSIKRIKHNDSMHTSSLLTEISLLMTSRLWKFYLLPFPWTPWLQTHPSRLRRPRLSLAEWIFIVIIKLSVMHLGVKSSLFELSDGTVVIQQWDLKMN